MTANPASPSKRPTSTAAPYIGSSEPIRAEPKSVIASSSSASSSKPEVGEEIVLQRNTFVERILPASVLRELTKVEVNIYRKRYLETR